MRYKQYCAVSGVLFVLVALAHLARILLGIPIQVDETAIPMMVSWIGFLVPAALAAWAFRINQADGTS